MLKFLKLGRIVRLLRLSTLWNFIQRFKFMEIFRMLRLFGVYLFVTHWIACLWYAVPWVEGNVFGASWRASSIVGSSWVTSMGLENASYGAKYVCSLYWAVTTIATSTRQSAVREVAVL